MEVLPNKRGTRRRREWIVLGVRLSVTSMSICTIFQELTPSLFSVALFPKQTFFSHICSHTFSHTLISHNFNTMSSALLPSEQHPVNMFTFIEICEGQLVSCVSTWSIESMMEGRPLGGIIVNVVMRDQIPLEQHQQKFEDTIRNHLQLTYAQIGSIKPWRIVVDCSDEKTARTMEIGKLLKNQPGFNKVIRFLPVRQIQGTQKNTEELARLMEDIMREELKICEHAG